MEPADRSEHHEFLALVEIAGENVRPLPPQRERHPQHSDAATDHAKKARDMQSSQQNPFRRSSKNRSALEIFGVMQRFSQIGNRLCLGLLGFTTSFTIAPRTLCRSGRRFCHCS